MFKARKAQRKRKQHDSLLDDCTSNKGYYVGVEGSDVTAVASCKTLSALLLWLGCVDSVSAQFALSELRRL